MPAVPHLLQAANGTATAAMSDGNTERPTRSGTTTAGKPPAGSQQRSRDRRRSRSRSRSRRERSERDHKRKDRPRDHKDSRHRDRRDDRDSRGGRPDRSDRDRDSRGDRERDGDRDRSRGRDSRRERESEQGRDRKRPHAVLLGAEGDRADQGSKRHASQPAVSSDRQQQQPTGSLPPPPEVDAPQQQQQAQTPASKTQRRREGGGEAEAAGGAGATNGNSPHTPRSDCAQAPQQQQQAPNTGDSHRPAAANLLPGPPQLPAHLASRLERPASASDRDRDDAPGSSSKAGRPAPQQENGTAGPSDPSGSRPGPGSHARHTDLREKFKQFETGKGPGSNGGPLPPPPGRPEARADAQGELSTHACPDCCA
jgi:hypothetical protein